MWNVNGSDGGVGRVTWIRGSVDRKRNIFIYRAGPGRDRPVYTPHTWSALAALRIPLSILPHMGSSTSNVAYRRYSCGMGRVWMSNVK